jgi:cytochrome c-type biogenesis protein CcmF
MVIAHFGIAVSLAGMASESAFIKEKLIAANVGESNTVGPYTVKFVKIEPVAGPNWTAIEATLEARRGDGDPMILRPQARMFSNPVTPTNEAAISTVFDGQLYINIGEPTSDGRWQIRMWWKPYVTLIWFGGLLIALGGCLSLIGRARREKSAQARKLPEETAVFVEAKA